ncbi:hypothetical protein [Nocardioides ungokensis]|uniref:hypothetical protein n=1 Tax=Nocardioides ungokensis TaxID=1643322 RepID=UPI001C60867D|nr:hypothetical protein [Nocardioides ungokensis]
MTEPRRHPVYHQWLRRRRHALSGLDLAALTVFMADGAYRPDFLDPSPVSSEPTFEEGMAALLAVPTEQVNAELVDAAIGRDPHVFRRLLDDPDRARSEAGVAVRRLWKAAVEPEWPSMRQALRTEMLDRAIQVSREGLRAVIPRLHHSMACEADSFTVERASRSTPTVPRTDPRSVTVHHRPGAVHHLRPLDSGALLPGVWAIPLGGTAHAEVLGPAPGTHSSEDPGRAHHSAADDRDRQAGECHAPNGQ